MPGIDILSDGKYNLGRQGRLTGEGEGFMERISKIDRSKKTLWALTVCIFLFALILNGLTPYVADDYVYRLSFDTKKELTGVVDVVKSMAVHAVRMNGRVESHFLGQLFMLWPKAVFNVVNAAVLTALLVLVAALCAGWKRPTALLLACAAMGFWKFCPVFGQTALWQIGSVNYLWGLFFGTVFLTPYIIHFLHGGGYVFGSALETGAFLGLFPPVRRLCGGDKLHRSADCRGSAAPVPRSPQDVFENLAAYARRPCPDGVFDPHVHARGAGREADVHDPFRPYP